jgi:hypothetical protein
MSGKYFPFAKIAYLNNYCTPFLRFDSVSCSFNPIEMVAGGLGLRNCSMVGIINEAVTVER